MSREETYQLKFIVALVADFAKNYQINQKQAYNYLRRFKGFDFLQKIVFQTFQGFWTRFLSVSY